MIHLAQLYLQTGELDKAEEHARRDESQAARWGTKRDEKIEELNRRARGDYAAGDGLPEQAVQAITQLALACVQAGIGGTELPAEAEAVIAQLESPDAEPLQPLVPYFRCLATGPAEQTASALAAPPADLPEALRPVFAQLVTALSESQQ